MNPRDQMIHDFYFKQSLSQKETAKRLGISRSTVGHAFKKNGWTGRTGRRCYRRKDDHPSEEEDNTVRTHNKEESGLLSDGSVKRSKWNELDFEEIFRLYFDEKQSMKDIASRYGYKTTGPIARVFRNQGWKSRPAATLEMEARPEEVHRLYFDEGLSLKEVAVKLGYRSHIPIRRIFKEQGWEARKQWRELDYDRIYELYFKRRMSLEKVAKEMELSSHYPIVCIFDEQGWKRRSPHGRRFKMNPDDVFEMYFVRKMTMKEIGEPYGYKSSAPIAALFREQGWNSRRTETVDMDINPDQVQTLYFEQGLPLEEVGRRIGKTRYALLKLFEK
ncbi:MAG: hypothetical protein ACFFER_10540, partial [Candidatus Thorarchaeota archaeon]